MAQTTRPILQIPVDENMRDRVAAAAADAGLSVAAYARQLFAATLKIDDTIANGGARPGSGPKPKKKATTKRKGKKS